MTTISDLIQRKKHEINSKINLQNDYAEQLEELRDAPDVSEAKLAAIRERKAQALADIARMKADLVDLERESEAHDETARKQGEFHPTSPRSDAASGVERSFNGRGESGQGVAFRRDLPGGWVRQDGEAAGVQSTQRFIDHPATRAELHSRSTADQAVIGTHGNVGNLVRSLTTSGGSAIVPTTWAADLIDRARAKSAILQAGSTLVPMDAKTVQLGRLTGDPTAAFRLEGSEIAASDPTFDNVTLTAKTMSALVVGTLEWFQDAENAEQVIDDAIAQAVAQQLDKVALYGGMEDYAGGAIDLPIADGNPRGVLAALNALLAGHVLGGATDGTTQTSASFFNELIDLLFAVRNSNEEPSGLVWARKPRSSTRRRTTRRGSRCRCPRPSPRCRVSRAIRFRATRKARWRASQLTYSPRTGRSS